MEVMLQELPLKRFLKKLWRLSFVLNSFTKSLVEILFCGFLECLHGPVRENQCRHHWKSALELVRLQCQILN